MPYKRKYTRKYNRKNRRGRRKKTSTRTLALRALKQNKPEYKRFFYIPPVNSVATWNGSSFIINNNIPQGTNVTDRIGDKIKLVNFTFRLTVEIGGNTTSIFRMIIWYDKQANIDLNALLEITGNQNIVNSFKDYDFRFKTKILFDRTVTLSSAGKEIYQINKVIRINRRTQYLTSSTNPTDGALRIGFMSNIDPTITGALPIYTMAGNLTYTDV